MPKRKKTAAPPSSRMKPSAVLDTRVIYCGDNLDQLPKLPDACVDLIYIDPPFNSNRNYEVFWGETKEKRAFEDRHASTQAYIDFMRPRCVELARVLKKTGSFLLSLRLARLALRQGDARPDFRREPISERNRVEAQQRSQRLETLRREPRFVALLCGRKDVDLEQAIHTVFRVVHRAELSLQGCRWPSVPGVGYDREQARR